MKAFEDATGETLDEDKKELASEELIITGDLGEDIGADKATGIVNDIKTEIIKNNTSDTIQIAESKQQVIVLHAPVRKSDNFWEYVVRLIDNTLEETLDLDACKTGMETRFLTNYQPEFSEEGYTKYQSNVEKHRNWIIIVVPM